MVNKRVGVRRPQAEIRAAFENELQRHLDAVESLVAAYDGSQHVKTWRDLPKQLRWLARYQCRSESFSEIAAAEFAKPHYQTVAVPVRQVAELLGLRLRPPTRGRPPRRKDSRPRWRRV